jgi:hypothetical protein
MENELLVDYLARPIAWGIWRPARRTGLIHQGLQVTCFLRQDSTDIFTIEHYTVEGVFEDLVDLSTALA